MEKASISLKDFLLTGDFGPVSLGMTREQVAACLGEPEHRSVPTRGQRIPAIWKYGDIEFHFSGNNLWLIFADNVEELDGGRAIKLDSWLLRGSATISQVMSALTAAGMSSDPIEWPHDDGTKRFRVGAGVELLFQNKSEHLFESCRPAIFRPSEAWSAMTFEGFSYAQVSDGKHGRSVSQGAGTATGNRLSDEA